MRRSDPDRGLQLSGRSPRGGHGVGRPGPPIHFAAQPGAAGSAGHTLIVMLENNSYSQVIGASSAPFLNELAHCGALSANSRAITQPAECRAPLRTCVTCAHWATRPAPRP